MSGRYPVYQRLYEVLQYNSLERQQFKGKTACESKTQEQLEYQQPSAKKTPMLLAMSSNASDTTMEWSHSIDSRQFHVGIMIKSCPSDVATLNSLSPKSKFCYSFFQRSCHRYIDLDLC